MQGMSFKSVTRRESCTIDVIQIYVVHALPQDYFVRSDGAPYDRSHYYANPGNYTSIFHERVSLGIVSTRI